MEFLLFHIRKSWKKLILINNEISINCDTIGYIFVEKAVQSRRLEISMSGEGMYVSFETRRYRK